MNWKKGRGSTNIEDRRKRDSWMSAKKIVEGKSRRSRVSPIVRSINADRQGDFGLPNTFGFKR